MLNNYLTIKNGETYIEQIKLHNYLYKNKLLNKYLTKYHVYTVNPKHIKKLIMIQ